MTNIKFKAKEWVNGIQTGVIVNGYLRFNNYGNAIISEWVDPNGYGKNGVLDEWVVDPNTICQFTGAKDVDGLEIHDGDICNNVKQDGKVYVGWNKMQHRWSYYDPIKDSVFCHLGQGDSDPAVVGNIYLNKELLNQSNK